jgi:FlaA1/EpsC-like NDP-sugar epimerase
MMSERLVRTILMRYRLLFILLFQAFLVVVSYIASFYIRFDFYIPVSYFRVFYKALPLLLIARMVAYLYYKIHASSWRFVSIKDLMDTLKAVLLGSVLFVIQMVFIYRLEEFPRSVFILEALISAMLMGGTRFMIRYYCEFRGREKPKTLKYVLIAGAGKAGVMVLNEVRSNTRLGIHVIGFVDDNPYKKGTNIQGIPVFGRIEEIPELVKKHGIDEVVIAIPSASYKDIVRISEIAKNAQVETRVLPSLGKLIQDGTITNHLKDVSCHDLLGRRVIHFCRESDYKLLKRDVEGKAVFITGAAGSIGSELCRQVAQFRPRILILYERYENSLYDLELELRKAFPRLAFLPVIGDILDTEKLRTILVAHGVDLIYHAAAYKHVPMMEREPIEAVRNNVVGTLNVATVAAENGVEKFVFISTDKAVNPANVMGTTKRVAELIIQGLNGNGTKFIAVRFGNVIGSNGSALPLFKKQIAEGGPVTVTHAEVTRYFMAIPEAVQLVMTAGAMGDGGEIFLLDMGEPIKIVDLARDLIRLSGLEPEKDIDIVFTGLRPGEKLYEELYWKAEGVVPTDNKKITMLKPNGSPKQSLFPKIDVLRESAEKSDVRGVLKLLKEIVPESTIKDEETPRGVSQSPGNR